jgi:HEAT repeat protein
MTGHDGRYHAFSLFYIRICRCAQVIKGFPFLLFILTLYLAGCNLFQRSELIRVQKQRSAANKYVAGNWMERRDVVREIVKYFGQDKNDLIIGTLLVASKDPYSDVRIEAVKGLAIIKSEKALDVIKKIASDDKDGNVRWYAIKELRSFKDPSIAEIYIKGLGSNDWLIREESIKGALTMDDAIIKVKMIPYIIKAINDTSSNVVYTALQKVKTKDARLYQAIANKFNSCSDYNYSLLEASLIALNGYRLDTKTREKVINLLVHDNTHIRLLALRVLKKDKILTMRQ